jgi:hypothetical protein
MYQPGLYDVDIDICDVAKNLYSKNQNFGRFFLDNAVENWRENYGHLLHPCPYLVSRKIVRYHFTPFCLNFLKGYHIINRTITGLPCKSIYDSEIYFGRFSQNTASKTEIMLFPNKNNKRGKPGILVTLFDEQN